MFQIENIYNMFDKDNKGTQYTTAIELSRLEQNYDIVSETAASLKKLPDLWLPDLDTTKFDCLIRDLRIVLSLVRREMGISGDSTAPPQATLPASFASDTFNCLCPLTVLLQAVASSLSKLNIQVRADNMGSATPFYRLLNQTEQKLIKVNGDGDFCAGLAHAITIHEKNSRFTIQGSAPRYGRLKGLQWFATDTRNKYLENLKSTLPQAVLDRLQDVEAVSKGISEAAKGGNAPTEPPAGYVKIPLDGTNITVTAKGQYKPACLSDYLRLAIATPPKATEEEARLPVGKRKAQNYKTCAEWPMVCYLFSSPDPTSQPSRGTPKPGHRKADSWPKDKEAGSSQQEQQQQQQQAKQGATNAAGRPSKLPPLGTPQGGKGRAPSPPGGTTTLADRTKRTDTSADGKPQPSRKISGQASASAADPRGGGR